MAMRSHTNKTSTQDSVTDPVQASLKSRPFAPPAKPDPSRTMADVQAQLEHAQRYGHSLSKYSLSPSPSASPMIQPKLTIGAPGDKYEQEADRIAKQVVQRWPMPMPGLGRLQPDSALQRQTVLEEDELQMKPLAEQIQRVDLPEEEDELQMLSLEQGATNGTMAASEALEGAIAQARGRGQPIADTIRQPMEQAFGADLSGVRVHTDDRSDRLNRSIQARAFTTGQDVFFRQGTYQPGSRGGQELIAHELTHVVQQSGGALQKKNLPPQQLRSHLAQHLNGREGATEMQDNKARTPWEQKIAVGKKTSLAEGEKYVQSEYEGLQKEEQGNFQLSKTDQLQVLVLNSEHNVVQRTPLGPNKQAIKGRIYLWQNGLVKVISTHQGAKNVNRAKVQRIWPTPSAKEEDIPSSNLDDGVDNPNFAKLQSEMRESQNKATEEEKVKKGKEQEKLKQPTVQWGQFGESTVFEIGQMIWKYLQLPIEEPSGEDKVGKAEKGVNELNEAELKCVRHYGKQVELKDPYIGIKQLENGDYVVMSNQGGIKKYGQNGSYLNDEKRMMKGEGRSVHCEAALNQLYDDPKTNHSPAKATKVEGGHSVGGAESQNCLLCSLDARRRGYNYDPHQNPPNYWNYKVTKHSKQLFPEDLLKIVMPNIFNVIDKALKLGIGELNPYRNIQNDQELVDTIAMIYKVALSGKEGKYIKLAEQSKGKSSLELSQGSKPLSILGSLLTLPKGDISEAREEVPEKLLVKFTSNDQEINNSVNTFDGVDQVLKKYQLHYISGEGWLCYIRCILLALDKNIPELVKVYQWLKKEKGIDLTKLEGEGVTTGSTLDQSILESISAVTGQNVEPVVVLPRKNAEPTEAGTGLGDGMKVYLLHTGTHFSLLKKEL